MVECMKAPSCITVSAPEKYKVIKTHEGFCVFVHIDPKRYKSMAKPQNPVSVMIFIAVVRIRGKNKLIKSIQFKSENQSSNGG